MRATLVVVALAVFAWLFYGEAVIRTKAEKATAAPPVDELVVGLAESPPPRPTVETPPPAVAVPPFNCDGRKHCSQMRSCVEATDFLRHCPGMEMDGDHDGVPCEQQWCN